MPPELRILGLGSHLPQDEVSNARLAAILQEDEAGMRERTGVQTRFWAPAGEGPSDLAARAGRSALSAAGTAVDELGIIIFATATPDVTFPGAACYLQEKLEAPTIGALDVRAQTVGFLGALDLAGAFSGSLGPTGSRDTRYDRVLVAAGEVFSSGLDMSPRGAELTPRFGDGAAVAVVGQGDRGARVREVRWRVEGEAVEDLWCEHPASRRHPLRVTREDIERGKHFPCADLAHLAPLARDRLHRIGSEVLEACAWSANDVDVLIIDYIEPGVAMEAAAALGIESGRVRVPTAEFGHVMAAGLPIVLHDVLNGSTGGQKILLVAAGSGLAYGAAALEA